MPKGKREAIDFDKIYSSGLDGDFIILKEVKGNTSNRYMMIRWLETGNEQVSPLSAIRKGELRDKKKRSIDYSKIYDSNNFGKFIILEELPKAKKSGHKMVKIKFLDTGTIKDVRLADALVGNIRDDYRPNICGIACIGNASSYDPAYNMWNGMIQRCYNPNISNYVRYGAKGVHVCDRWLCFEYFLEDLPYIDGYDKWVANRSSYQLDKDYKQQGVPYNKRIYSLETCCFLQNADNSCLSNLSKSKYMGVRHLVNYYNTNIYYNGAYHNLGTYKNEEDAAAAYNNAVNFLYTNRLILNDVEHVQPEELEKRKIRHVEMCKIIKPNQFKY